MENQKKTFLLFKLIDDLCDKSFAQNSSLINDWLQNLNRIYANNYRHSYSDISYKIQEIISINNSETLETLGENLNVLLIKIQEAIELNPEDANLRNTITSYKKFMDHIHLEIGRFNFIKNQLSNSSNASNPDKTTPTCSPTDNPDFIELCERVNTIEKDLINQIKPISTQAKSALENLDSKLESNKISSLTTLTIFSAVILAFSGGITFEAGMLQGMVEASPYRLVFTIALTGFILFNTIYALLYIVSKMAGKNISSKCKYWKEKEIDGQCTRFCEEGYCTKNSFLPCFIAKLIYKYAYFYSINIILLGVMYIDFFLWYTKGEIFSKVFMISIITPLLIISLIFIVIFLQIQLQKNRHILVLKIRLLQTLLQKNENDIFDVLRNLGQMVAQVLDKKIEKENWIEIMSTMNYKQSLKYLNLLAKSQMRTHIVLQISNQQHKLNKKKWKILKTNFQKQKNSKT